MTHYDPRPGINRTMEEMQAENEQLRAEAENAGNREVKAWAARDQYMESNVKLVAMVERLRAALIQLNSAIDGYWNAPHSNHRAHDEAQKLVCAAQQYVKSILANGAEQRASE